MGSPFLLLWEIMEKGKDAGEAKDQSRSWLCRMCCKGQGEGQQLSRASDPLLYTSQWWLQGLREAHLVASSNMARGEGW